MIRNNSLLQIAAIASAMAAAGSVDAATATFPQPDFDRWNYPFNSSPGIRATAPVFSSIGDELEDSFDNRDGQLLLGFDTSLSLPAPAPGFRYQLQSVTVTATHSTGVFDYDPTYDPYTRQLDPLDPDFTPDADAGRPISLFGAALRNGFTSFAFGPTVAGPTDFEEGEAYGPSTFGKAIRNAYPVAYDGTGALVDVSNNVDDRFDPTPFAVGTTNLAPGSAVVEAVPGTSPGSTFTFGLNLANPGVESYVQQGLTAGQLFFSITSLHLASQQVGGGNPNFYLRDSFDPAAVVPTLAIDYALVLIGDLDNDGFVGISDLNLVLGAWNQNVPPADPAADPSGDGFVGIEDLNAVLGNWNAGTPPASAAVPEPDTLACLVVALVSLGRRRG